MTECPKVSVLTPVYNVEPFLRQCLDSLAAQTLEDVEFICVNDGSTDGSLEVLREYEARDSRFRIIDKPNSGYGASMNRALDAAQGEYIGILESDDFAEPVMFEKLYELAAENNCEIARANRFDYTKDKDKPQDMLRDAGYGKVFCPIENKLIFRPAPCIWSQVYKRSFLVENRIRFLETPGASFQDTGFVYKSYIAAKRMVLMPDALIHYRMDNMGSSVKSASKANYILEEFASIYQFLAQRPVALREFASSFQALRYQAYQWNYNRLGWALRRDFLLRMAQEFQEANKAGELEADCFNELDWWRLQRMIENPEEILREELPRVSVIVPAYNCEAHIADTIESLQKNAMRDIQVIVVDDGSTDNTARIVGERIAGDNRFELILQPNRGVGCARNAGLDAAVGEFVSFVDGEDTVPFDALEQLYRHAKRSDADMSIGVIEEFDPVCKRKFERTVWLSRRDEIDRYDTDIVWSFSVNNKLFRRELIERLGLRFGDTLIAEDGVFCLSYVFACGKIVGCPHVVLNYRRNLFWDGFSCTRMASGQKIRDLVANYELLIELVDERFAQDIEAAGSDYERSKLVVQRAEYEENLHRKLLSYLIDLQYRQVWMLEDGDLDYLRSKVAQHRQHVSPQNWANTCAYHADLDLDALPGKRDLAALPLVTVALGCDMPVADAADALDCLYHCGFPAFEVLVSEKIASSLADKVIGKANMRVLPGAYDAAVWKNAAVAESRSPMMLFLEDRVFPYTGSLFKMWEGLRNSQADFVVSRIRFVNGRTEKGRYYRFHKVLFDERHIAGYSYRDSVDSLDCSLGNKLFKTQSLRDFKFSGDVKRDCSELYRTLDFKCLLDPCMITDVSEVKFLEGTRKSAQLKRDWERAISLCGRAVQSPEKVQRLVGRKTATIARKMPLPKGNRVVFFSNKGFTDNLSGVYEAVNGRKEVVAKLPPHSKRYNEDAMKRIARARLIVADDTCQYLRKLKLRKGQKFVQLWHAAGAFKKFGLDNYQVDYLFERAAHEQYFSVITSSEFVRPIYARAFGIPLSKTLALGVPRTDVFFDEALNEAKRRSFLQANPAFAGKRIVLYCPTFRQDGGKQCAWSPCIDWKSLSDSLDGDVMLLVKPHPLERFDLLEGKEYPNIKRAGDSSTSDLLPCVDLLVTDYSSVIFDAVLLDVPILFYAPDIERYQTGFYLRYPDDLPGLLISRAAELIEAMSVSLAGGSSNLAYEVFKRRYLAACDGHATDRVAAYLRSLVD